MTDSQRRFLPLIRAALLILSLLMTQGRARSAQQSDPLCFDVPGVTNCIEGRFLQFWAQNGGLAVFGYPITAAGYLETGAGTFLTQYFERARFEYHPERTPPYDVLLGRLGADRLRALGQDWGSLPKADPAAPHYFAATGHAIAHEPFWSYWQTHGLQDPELGPFDRSLALFGLPISVPRLETNAAGITVLTQWFERARFEDHGASGVLLGRLGSETRPAQPIEPAAVPPALPEPTTTPTSTPSPTASATATESPTPIATATLSPTEIAVSTATPTPAAPTTTPEGIPPTATPTPESVAATATATPSATPQGDKVVYLTFDDGPFPVWTERILEVLSRYNARATFFAVGRQVPGQWELVEGIARQGSTLGNHTYNHASLTSLSREGFNYEVLAAEAAYGPYASKCLRPPYAHVSSNVYQFAADLGYRVVMWDIDPRDWSLPGPQQIATHVLERVQPGKIVLLHDGGGNRAQTVAALEIILPALAAQGYRFEPVCSPGNR